MAAGTQDDLHEAARLSEAQQAAIAAVRPGATATEVDGAARRVPRAIC